MVEQYFTPEQLAQKLNFPKQTIWRWIRLGKIKAVCISNHSYRIAESEIKRFIEESEKNQVTK